MASYILTFLAGLIVGVVGLCFLALNLARKK